MPNLNPECCGGSCRSAIGEVRKYPLGSGANLILCRSCWEHENAYRRERGRHYGRPEDWPILDWNTAEPYPERDPTPDTPPSTPPSTTPPREPPANPGTASRVAAARAAHRGNDPRAGIRAYCAGNRWLEEAAKAVGNW